MLAATHEMVVVAQGIIRERSSVQRKCYKCGRENHFASVCYAANKMHFVKHESSSAYVNEPIMPHESNVEYNHSLYYTCVISKRKHKKESIEKKAYRLPCSKGHTFKSAW